MSKDALERRLIAKIRDAQRIGNAKYLAEIFTSALEPISKASFTSEGIYIDLFAGSDISKAIGGLFTIHVHLESTVMCHANGSFITMKRTK